MYRAFSSMNYPVNALILHHILLLLQSINVAVYSSTLRHMLEVNFLMYNMVTIIVYLLYTYLQYGYLLSYG
jgi:hypothetical protein